MAAARVVKGVVKNGIVIPAKDAALPEGADVEIVLLSAPLPPEMQAEFAEWERASDEAWSLIDRLEEEEGA